MASLEEKGQMTFPQRCVKVKITGIRVGRCLSAVGTCFLCL
jgi:hypothetical protein